MYDRWFTIALLTSGFGQVWAKLGLQISRTTLGEIVGLHNCAVADKGSIDEYYRELDKAGIRKSHTTLGEIVGLHNCAVADKGSIEEYYRELDKAGITKIAYNFRRDRRTAQLCSCRQRIN